MRMENTSCKSSKVWWKSGTRARTAWFRSRRERVWTGVYSGRKRSLKSQSANHPAGSPTPTLAQADGWKVIPTSFGEGKDTFVTSEKNASSSGTSPFFRVKFTSIQPNLVRVGYLAFDVSGMDLTSVSDAELVLNIEPSDLGFASLVPDSEFTVYGLTDESGDGWNEKSMKWEGSSRA